MPLFPWTHRSDLTKVVVGEVVARKKGSYTGESGVRGTTSMAGAGSEEYAMYSDDIEMVKTLIMSQYDIIGIACTGYDSAFDAPDQGFVTAVAGSHTIHKMFDYPAEPGQILRATLCDPDPSYAQTGKLTKSGLPLAKYPWKLVPEDYMVPGDLLLNHINAILEDDGKWKKSMAGGPRLDADKWLAVSKAVGDSSIVGGLSLVYVLMKMGYLASADPTGNADPYGGDTPVQSGGIIAGMKASAFVVKMSELLGTQPLSGFSPFSDQEMTYFSSLRRRILMTTSYHGKFRPLEFGQKDDSGIQCRDSKGAVDLGSPGGLFLDAQINHKRIEMGALLQAMDEHKRFRVGEVLSGPNRQKKININICRT